MSVKVYGTDAFTVGADTFLSAYNANWVNDSVGAAELKVFTATNDVRKTNTGSNSIATYSGTLSTEHRIKCDIFSGNTGAFPALWVRKQVSPNKQSGYLVQWDSGGTIILYRVAPDATFTVVQTNGTVAVATLYTGAYAQASGIGATVTITYGDATNGNFTFNDGNAARWITGKVGFEVFDSTGPIPDSSFDNMEIWDDSLGGHGILLAGQRNRSIV